MATLHMTEEEFAKDVRSVLAQVSLGATIVIEREDHSSVVVNKAASFRTLDEIVADLRANGSGVVPDAEFAEDMRAVIEGNREPLDVSMWD